MVHTKIHHISPGCPWPKTPLQWQFSSTHFVNGAKGYSGNHAVVLSVTVCMKWCIFYLNIYNGLVGISSIDWNSMA